MTKKTEVPKDFDINQFLSSDEIKLSKQKQPTESAKEEKAERTITEKVDEKTKYEIYHAIKANLIKSGNWTQFEQLLKQQGITIAYKYKGQTNEIQGISFKKGDYSFKGSDVDRSFSYSKLNNKLTDNTQKQSINIQSKDTTQQANSSNSASFVGSVLGALGGLTNIQPNGDNFQEEAFKKRKKKKKGKRL